MASLKLFPAVQILSRPWPPTRGPTLALRRLESSLTRPQSPIPAPSRTDPNYDAEPDKATSTFTPASSRVLDGSEEGHMLPAGLISGAPIELQARSVRIYQETKPATQSGTWRGHRWRLDWDILPKGHRWENPLMGWQSSGDFMQGTHLNFQTKEDAIAFAEKQGYEYFVQEPNSPRFMPKAYANNFMYSAGPLKIVRSK